MIKRLSLALLMVIAWPTFAVEWEYSPLAELSITHTDNLNRANDDNKESTLITTVTPGLVVERNSRLIKSRTDYRLNASFYSDFPNEERIYHQLVSTNQVKVEGTGLTLGLNLNYQQRIINASLFDVFVITADKDQVENTATGEFVANYVSDFGNGRGLTSNYQFRQQKYFESENLSNRSQRLSMAFRDANPLRRVYWSVSGQANHSDYFEGNEQDYLQTSAYASLGFRFSRGFSVYTDLGVESYTFDDQDAVEEEYAYGGIRFEPYRRVLVDVAAGRRGFGDSYRADIRYNTKRSLLTFSYNEDYSDYAQSLAYIDFDASLDQGQLVVGLLEIRDVYVVKKSEFAYHYTLPKTTLKINASSETREYENLPFVDEVVGGETSLSWKPRPKHRAEFKYSQYLNIRDLGAGEIDNQLIVYSLAWVYSPKRKIETSLTYRQSRNESEIDADEYVQNNIELRATARF